VPDSKVMNRGPKSDHAVVWTRGKGCAELADLLGEGSISRVGGDPAEACIEYRADLLVARRFPGGLELVDVAVPVDFQPEKVTSVVATVAGGPHSVLAAETAAHLGAALGVPAEMVSGSAPDQGNSAEDVLKQIGLEVPDLSGRVIEVEGISELVDTLDDGALLILGAPGGSWLQRSMFGPGARLRRTAQAGVVVVRSAPDRVFRFMGEPVYVSPLRHADDTLRIHDENTLAVADEGRLVGLVRRERLREVGANVVESVMEEAVSVKLDETLSEARFLEETFGTDPIPVTDHDEHLVGALSLRAG
jgi:CBS domain-containing protein